MHLYFSVFCFSCLLIFNSINVVAQSASASTKEKEYLIGDWIPVDLFVSSTANNRVAFPNLKDSISETIEVANFTPIDTIKNGNQFEYHMYRIRVDAEPELVLDQNEHQNHVWVTAEEALELPLVADMDECVREVWFR